MISTVYQCDRCGAQFSFERNDHRREQAPRAIKLEIPLSTPGMVFTRADDLCIPCREQFIETVKRALSARP